jgi:Protein of unknown function (DUF3352)
MKKTVVWTLTLALAVIGLSACKSKSGAASEDILTWLPQAAQGVVVIDVKRGMTTEFVDKTIKENKKYEEYQKFIKDTGIDPQKDIYALAVALMSETDAEGKMKAQPGIVVNLAYKKDVLLAKLKEKATDVTEKDYDGVVLYGFKDEESKQPMFGAFYDETHLLFGTEGTIKAMIDVAKKKTPNVLKSEALIPLMKTANKSAMLWAAISIPKEMSAEAEKNPMTADLQSITAVMLAFDYRDKALQFEIKGVGGDADKNKKLADTLNGFKALGGMAGGEKPEIGELINKIEISSAPDYVKIYANLPEDLLTKLGKTAQAAVEEKMGAAKPEEKKEEVIK